MSEGKGKLIQASKVASTPVKKPAGPPVSGARIKELKIKVADASKELDRIRGAVKAYKNLPLIRQSLQGKIRELAQEIYTLRRKISLLREAPATEARLAVLTEDYRVIKDS